MKEIKNIKINNLNYDFIKNKELIDIYINDKNKIGNISNEDIIDELSENRDEYNNDSENLITALNKTKNTNESDNNLNS